MEFMLWATRSLHIFSTVIWLGGNLFIGGVLYPILEYDAAKIRPEFIAVQRRFLGFVWMSAWTVGVTGLFLMLFNTRFVLGEFPTGWDYLLLGKQIIFVFMVILSVSNANLVKKMESIIATAPEDDIHSLLGIEIRRSALRRRYNITLGFLAVLFAARMALT